MEKEKEFTITAFSENAIGLLNRITIIFTRRHLNIESLTVSESAIQGIPKFTIVVTTTREMIEKVVKQIEKLVDVLMAFYLNGESIVDLMTQKGIGVERVPLYMCYERPADFIEEE